MISKNIKNWIFICFSIFIGWFIHERYKNRVSIEDQRTHLANFYQNIIYYDNERKKEDIYRIQKERKLLFRSNVGNPVRANNGYDDDLQLLRSPSLSTI
tara:strand:- start:555 stop:851 length:297 start_codon:yes stop_codon:yes gene_type:complete